MTTRLTEALAMVSRSLQGTGLIYSDASFIEAQMPFRYVQFKNDGHDHQFDASEAVRICDCAKCALKRSIFLLLGTSLASLLDVQAVHICTSLLFHQSIQKACSTCRTE